MALLIEMASFVHMTLWHYSQRWHLCTHDFISVHRLAKYVVGPQGLGQEKVAGPAKNSKGMLIADVIYIFQATKFSKLIPTLNKLHIHTATHVYKYSYKSTH